jgi:hypothetical protein
MREEEEVDADDDEEQVEEQVEDQKRSSRSKGKSYGKERVRSHLVSNRSRATEHSERGHFAFEATRCECKSTLVTVMIRSDRK